MPIITIYKCDHCGNTQTNTDDDMHYVGILVKDIHPCYARSPGHEQLWCSKCLIEVGIVNWKQPAATPPATPPTLEDMIIEIVDSAIENQE